MGTKVADVMTQRPRAVTPQTPLNEVAEVMETDDVGAVPLVEGDRLVGIVTDRDIVVRAVAKGKDPRGMPASEVSSRELLTVSPDDDLSDALKLMAQYQVRRLAVTAEDDRLVGVVSQADVALQGKDKDTGQLVRVFRDSRKARAHPDLRARVVGERGARRRLAHLRNGSGSSKGISSRGAAGLEPATPGAGIHGASAEIWSIRGACGPRTTLDATRWRSRASAGLSPPVNSLRAGFLPDSFA